MHSQISIYLTLAVGNRTTMALVGTGTFSYDYDAVDRLKTMVTPAGERYTQQYDADSRRTTLLLGLGSKRKYQYDSVGRLTTQVEYNASNQGIYTMVDSYDAVGNRAGAIVGRMVGDGLILTTVPISGGSLYGY